MKIDYDKLIVYDGCNHKRSDIKITVSGDWCPVSGGMSSHVIKMGSSLYGDLLPLFDIADYNFFNLETVIDDNQSETRNSWEFIDNSLVISEFKNIKLNVACLANNHILDGGIAGLKSATRHLHNQGIKYIGAGLSTDGIYKPLLINKENSSVAVINIADGEKSSESLNGGFGSADIESYKVYDSIRNLKNNNNIVVVIVHAGVEFSPIPPPFIVKIYQSYVDCGADLVIGHHPHVVQGCQIYNGKPIFYSLGHLYLYREVSRSQEKIGMLLSISINGNKISKIELKPFKIQSEGVSLLKDDQLENFKSKFKYLSSRCSNQEFVHEFWKKYADIKKSPLVFKEINKLYRVNSNKFYASTGNLFTSLNTRYLFMENYDNIKYNQEVSNLINEYQLSSKIFFLDKAHLKSKDIYKGVHSLLMSIKFWIKKCFY